MDEAAIIDDLPGLLGQAPDLEGAWITGVDLRGAPLPWADLMVRDATFAGCQVEPHDEVTLRAGGATVLAPIDGLAFSPYRARLYTNAELMGGFEPGHPETTLDARIGAAGLDPPGRLEALARGVHDACIDAALTRFLAGAPGPVVGVMGSHATRRDAPEYRLVTDLGRALTRDGFVVATGGGPGLMEAANLGAWLAGEPDDAVDEALAVLGRAPDYEADPAGYLDAAIAVRSHWPEGGTSLGVPTWLYVDEPLNQFSTHIAKYFQNSVRENGLLAIALGGVVYTPGGSGTAQEIFTDAAQNDYTLHGVRSPMVFLGRDHYERVQPGLVAGVLDLARRGGWADLVRVVDRWEDALVAIRELVHPEAGPPPAPLRKR